LAGLKIEKEAKILCLEALSRRIQLRNTSFPFHEERAKSSQTALPVETSTQWMSWTADARLRNDNWFGSMIQQNTMKEVEFLHWDKFPQ
jgi:hypothetical protein